MCWCVSLNTCMAVYSSLKIMVIYRIPILRKKSTKSVSLLSSATAMGILFITASITGLMWHNSCKALLLHSTTILGMCSLVL